MKKNKIQKEELPAMPARDEIGQAAHNLIQADQALTEAQEKRDLCEKTLFRLMSKAGRQNLSINDYRFSVRIRPTREIVAVSKPR